jgi:hypothetical protein
MEDGGDRTRILGIRFPVEQNGHDQRRQRKDHHRHRGLGGMKRERRSRVGALDNGIFDLARALQFAGMSAPAAFRSGDCGGRK